MSQVVREQCHGITERRKVKHRCKHVTLKGIYCHQHLKKLTGLAVRKSTVAPRSGMGLWNIGNEIPPGKQIADYSGDRVVSHDPNFGNPYVLQIKKRPPTFIDAAKTNTGYGRWANDRKGNNNADLVYNTRTQKAYLKSKKKIPSKTEITTAYGATYWRHYKKKSVKKAKKSVAKRSRA